MGGANGFAAGGGLDKEYEMLLDALGGVRRKIEMLRGDFDRWEALSLSTVR